MTHNRPNDLGYLIARIFINKENHYFVEGSGSWALYNDFSSLEFLKRRYANCSNRRSCTVSILTRSPPYDQVIQVTVGEIQETRSPGEDRHRKALGLSFSD